MKTVVRVAVSNNFNCTEAEFSQLDSVAFYNPDKYFFINTNIHTPDLARVNDHPYKVLVTANPNLLVTAAGIKKILTRLNMIKDMVAFVRVKYLPQNRAIEELINTLIKNQYPVVITNQRFNSLESLSKYTSPGFYKYSDSRYRLAGHALKTLYSAVKVGQAHGNPVWICDKAGKGCGACGLCSKLTVGKKLPIYSLNLSTSGVCPFNCPDCYAKTSQIRTCGKISFNKIAMNGKQAGTTKHILRNKGV